MSSSGRSGAGSWWSQKTKRILIRNILVAKRYVLQRYGVDLETLQLTDIPGVVPQLPQLCRGLGIRHLVVTRCAPPDRLFWYVGPDGSEILVWSANGYNQAAAFGSHISTEAMEERGLAAHLGDGPVPPLLYYGSDLYLPAETLATTSAEFSASHPETPVRLTTPSGYFNSLPEDLVESAPRWSGTLPSTWLYQEPTHANITRLDSVATGMVLAAERWATLAWLKVRMTYPRQELGELWKMVLKSTRPQFRGTWGTIGTGTKAC